MNLFNNKLFYAVEAVVTIAYNSGVRAISGKEIACLQGLSARYLEQIMQSLVRAGILRGMRGPNGGYVLAKERRRITVSDIYEAISGDLEKDNQTSKERNESTELSELIIKPVFKEFDEVMLRYLEQINIESLCEKASLKNIGKSTDEKIDFII
ncbi:MAG: Rrf2 family transcriptional regulator [Rickettsiales bacterium]